MCDSLDFFSGVNSAFSVERDGVAFSVSGKLSGNTLTVSKQLIQGDIVTDKNGNRFTVILVQKRGINFIATVKPYFQSQPAFSQINNSNIIVNSPNAVISSLPEELKPLAEELYRCLIDIAKTGTKPKNFKEKFGQFITDHSGDLVSLGTLALNALLSL